MRTRHVFVAHVTIQHVNKKKSIELKSRQYLRQPELKKLDIFAELELKKI